MRAGGHRTASGKTTAHPTLHPQKGDADNADEVARLVAGHDAVISAFNPGWNDPDIYNHQVKGTEAIITGVKQAGPVRRTERHRGCCGGTSHAIQGKASVPWKKFLKYTRSNCAVHLPFFMASL